MGTCYFWNECSMHPIEVSYPLTVQVLATCSHLTQSSIVLLLRFYQSKITNMISSHYLLPSAEIKREQAIQEKQEFLSYQKLENYHLVVLNLNYTLESPWELLEKYQCWGPIPEQFRQTLWEWSQPGHWWSFKSPCVILLEGQG